MTTDRKSSGSKFTVDFLISDTATLKSKSGTDTQHPSPSLALHQASTTKQQPLSTVTESCKRPSAPRIRTVFTKLQLAKMEAKFAEQQYLVGEERRQFAASIGLNQTQVKVWFQNRRIKWRREQHEINMHKLQQLKRKYGFL